MVPVGLDELVASLEDDIDLVERADLAVDDDLADEDDDEAYIWSGPIRDPITAGWSKLNQFGSGMARFKPIFQSMTTGMVNEAVDGLVVLETGLKADDKSTQLVVEVVLGPTDGWSENAENAVVEPALSHSQSELLS